MSRKTGKNPGRPRHIRGIPAAGPLFVNGVEAPKGNLPQQVKRVYDGIDKDRPVWEVVQGKDLPEHVRTCRDCDEPIHRSAYAIVKHRRKGADYAWHRRCRPAHCPL